MDYRGWLYCGTRFVSSLSQESTRVMLFSTFALAEAVANHLRIGPVASGIRPKHPEYMVLKNAEGDVIGPKPKPFGPQKASGKKAGPRKTSLAAKMNAWAEEKRLEE